MIRKTQLRFLVLIMSILLAVFIVAFCACLIFINLSCSRRISSKLDDCVFFYENSNQTFLPDSVFALVSKLPNGDYNINRIEFDTEVFDDDSAKNFINDICIKEIDYGNVENYYFKIYPSSLGTHQQAIITCDMNSTIQDYKKDILYVGLTFICVYVLLYVLVYGLSYRIIQPLKDNMAKQKQFISNASHELKTPITIISANADVLIANENNVYLDNIKSQTQRIEDLVQDMLTLAKLDEGVPLDLTDFSLSDEVLNTTLPFEALAFEKDRRITTDVLPNVTYHGDRQSIKKVLSILIDNAIKYSAKDSEIKVSLKKEARPVIKVFNDGSEIESFEAQKIFNRFYRGDNSRSRNSGGSGLGLSIAKSICDNNKWKISAQSIYKKSMCITIIL